MRREMSRGGKITGAIVGVLIAGSVGAYVRFGRTGGGSELKFETVKVERGRLVARVTATGTVSALVTVQVGAQVSGRLKEIHVDFNSTVKKGQLLARLDPELYDAAVQQARANLVGAQGSLAKAQAQAADAKRIFARNKELNAQKLVSQADLDTSLANTQAADAQIAVAQGALDQSIASLHQANINVEYTTIRSPIDGTVISRSVDVGQTVAASLSAPTLFTIAEDLRKMQVDTSVSEADVGKLKDGMETFFTVDAYPQEKFRGKVRQIRNAPTTVQNVVTYDAVIDVANPDLRLRPGMTANVTFVYAEVNDALRVPNAALRFRPPPELGPAPNEKGAWKKRGESADGGAGATTASAAGKDAKEPGKDAPVVVSGASGGRRREGGGGGGGRDPNAKKTVWVLHGTKPEPVLVKTGVSDGSFSEIVEGDVKEGDLLVTEATGGAKSGMPSVNPFGGGPPGGGGGGPGGGRRF